MDVIIATILTNAITLGVVGILLKIWVDKRLSHSLDIKLERFKSALAKEVTHYSIQQQWVNDKRMELFGQLYELIVDTNFELQTLFLNVKVQNHRDTQSRASKFCEKYTELNAVLHKNEIFLSHEILEEIRTVYRPFFEICMACVEDAANADKIRAYLPDTLEEITSLADEPRKRIVRAFRLAAGIEE